MIGETILHYKIIEKLGEGGMGEVYKAQDTKLDRFVALKFLPSQLTATEEEKARFIQEAKAASSMNHPNVCTIYSIEEYNSQLFISMEYIEGKTLRDKKDHLSEKQILEIGIQVAEGLAAAHEKGIVHRDIKPENIMVRKDGIVQIMDFGLAKLYKSSNVSRLTKAGTTMGTVGYMSPEQVQGLDIDHRTDIFSLGVVLYELLAGDSPFKGMHETAIMYEIVNVDPQPIATLKENFSPELDEIILECMEKDKDERCQSARELAKDLRKVKKSSAHRKSRVYNVNSGINRTSVQQTTATNLSGPLVYDDVPLKKLLRNIIYNRKILWTGLSICLIAAILFLYLFLANKSSGNSSGIYSFAASVDPPPKYKFAFSVNDLEGVHLAVSPDGKMLAFVALDSSSNSSIWVRPLDGLAAQKLNGTDGAYYPFWSYDSKYIAYFADGKLKKILASGGPSVTICKANSGRGGSWNQNDMIVFEPDQTTGIFKVPASGGEPVEITKLDTAKGEQTHRWPCFLPDGNHFIFYSRVVGNSQEGDAVYLSSLDGKEIKKLFTAHSNAVYADNNILFVQDNTLMAQPFNPGNLELSGVAVPLEENVLFTQRFSCGVFSVSNNGVLFYQRGNTERGMRFAWYDRNGNQESVFGKPDDYRDGLLSPDGTKIALQVYDENTRHANIWLYDIKRKINIRFTFSAAGDFTPVWSPDGKWIVFSSSRNKGKIDLFKKSASGIGDVIQLTNTGQLKEAFSWSSNNKYIGFYENNTSTKVDACILPVSDSADTSKTKPIVLFKSQFNEYGVFFSPDSKWIFSSSNESGQDQLYVSPFPNITSGRWQVTTSPVTNFAQWDANGKGIYYTNTSNQAIYVEVNPHGNQFDIGKTTTLFDIPFSGRAQLKSVTKDDKHFLFFIPVQSTETPPLTIVTNWDKKLKQGD
jgi:serine/threonine protein kinase/Tol biopolymer transport system component